LHFRLQSNTIARHAETVAASLDSLHWEVALLREVVRRNQRPFGLSTTG
jgi:hypothetical protein